MECIFCKIVSGKLPCYKVWEDEQHLAFLNIFPNTDGYTVVVKKEHVSSDFSKADEKHVLELVSAARKVSGKLTSAYKDTTRCGMVFEGIGVDHLHAQVIPFHGSAEVDWRPPAHASEEFFYEWPGYTTTQITPNMADSEHLAEQAELIRKAK